MTRSVLALDLATTTGWAVHSEGMDRPFLGSIKFKSAVDEIGPQLVKLQEFLVDQHRMHRLTDLVFEAQIMPHGVTQPTTVYRLFNLGGHCEYFAARAGIRCFKMPISTWRKHAIGKPPKGGQWKKDEAKKAALAACRALGWITASTDAADAACILDAFLAMIPNHHRPWRDRNLMGGIS